MWMLGGRVIEICGCWEEGRLRYVDAGRKRESEILVGKSWEGGLVKYVDLGREGSARHL